MPPELPSVGVVVVNHNGAAFNGEFAESLRQVDYPEMRVFIVDAASTDGSAGEQQRQLPAAEVIRCNDNVGTAGGNNAGAARCLALGLDRILFLNNDTVLSPAFLRTLAAASGDGRTIVVPKILYYYDRSLISTHAGGFDWTLGLFRHTYHGQPDGPATSHPRDLETASFCCALVPAAAWQEAGPLDEAFFMYYEETDWLRRALDAGYRLRYEPDAVIYHKESASSGGGWMTPFKHYYATRNRFYLVRKHRASRAAYAWFTAYMLAGRAAQLARHLLRRDRRMARALVLAVRDYYRGRMGRTLEVGDL